MLENIFLAGIHFPTWKIYIYYAPDVTEGMMKHLAECSSVVLIPTHVNGPANMIHRFYAIDEPEVDLMLVRDADSRIHWKDRWAIREFVQSSCVAHTIRDNIEHTALMMGGLWGLKKSAGISMRRVYSTYVEDIQKGHRHAHDQNFLGDVIYPLVLNRLLVHYSNGRVRLGEIYTVEFPFNWNNDVYCGRVELEYLEYPEPPRSRPRSFVPPQSPARTIPPVTHFLTRR
jgi:hypothetical protein